MMKLQQLVIVLLQFELVAAQRKRRLGNGVIKCTWKSIDSGCPESQFEYYKTAGHICCLNRKACPADACKSGMEAATLADDFRCASAYCTIDECCRVLPLCSDDELDDGDRCQDKDSVQCEKKRIVNEKCTFPGFTIRRHYRSDCSDGLNSCLKVDGQPNKKIYDLEEAMTKCKENPECGKIMQEEDGTYNLRYAKDPVKGPSWKSGLTILFEKIEVEIGDYGDYADYGDYGDHGDYSDDNSSDASLDVNCGLGRAPTCSDCSKLWCYADCELVKNECRLKDATV